MKPRPLIGELTRTSLLTVTVTPQGAPPQVLGASLQKLRQVATVPRVVWAQKIIKNNGAARTGTGTVRLFVVWVEFMYCLDALARKYLFCFVLFVFFFVCVGLFLVSFCLWSFLLELNSFCKFTVRDGHCVFHQRSKYCPRL